MGIAFCNREFYQNNIKSHMKSVDAEDIKLHKINTMLHVTTDWKSETTVHKKQDVPIYVVRVDKGKPKRDDNKSWKNEEEALFICRDLLGCCDIDEDDSHDPFSIGIISFYKSQASLISKHIKNGGIDQKFGDIMSSTVDAFQGKEKDLIILSLVNDVVGNPTIFNLDYNRINVALSRCQKALVVVTSLDFNFDFSKLQTLDH